MKLDDVVTCKGFNVAERSVSYHCLLCRKAAYHAYVGRKRGLGSFDHDEEVSAYLTAGAEVRARRIDARSAGYCAFSRPRSPRATPIFSF